MWQASQKHIPALRQYTVVVSGLAPSLPLTTCKEPGGQLQVHTLLALQLFSLTHALLCCNAFNRFCVEHTTPSRPDYHYLVHHSNGHQPCCQMPQSAHAVPSFHMHCMHDVQHCIAASSQAGQRPRPTLHETPTQTLLRSPNCPVPELPVFCPQASVKVLTAAVLLAPSFSANFATRSSAPLLHAGGDCNRCPATGQS